MLLSRAAAHAPLPCFCLPHLHVTPRARSGRAGSAFAWWILVCSALLAVGSFIAW